MCLGLVVNELWMIRDLNESIARCAVQHDYHTSLHGY